MSLYVTKFIHNHGLKRRTDAVHGNAKLVIIRGTREVILPADASRLLPVDSLQLRAVGDPVAEAAAISAASLSVSLQELLFLGLEVGQELWDFLTGFDEQVLEVEQDGVLHGLVDQRGGVALLVATTGTTDSVDIVGRIDGDIVINDYLHLWDIEATGADVG